jgi:N1-aminopropylagmatine ureohydrolase
MTAQNFLDLSGRDADAGRAAVFVLPIPLEVTVSWGGGTARGPAAIIDASTQVELYDREFDSEPALLYGVHTLAPVTLPADPPTAVDAIESAVAAAAGAGKLLVGLGGEHTVSVGFGRGLLRALEGPLTVVQIDAHCDLRDAYEGSPYSHACVARRLLESSGIEQVLQLGIRSLDVEEVTFARANSDRLRIWFAEEVHAGAWQEELQGRLRGKRVYLTIDVDGLDPAVVPATGTPEPDGLSWSEALEIVRAVTTVAPVVGLDCVELAPHAGQHAADFAVAKLLYKTISYVMHDSVRP